MPPADFANRLSILTSPQPHSCAGPPSTRRLEKRRGETSPADTRPAKLREHTHQAARIQPRRCVGSRVVRPNACHGAHRAPQRLGRCGRPTYCPVARQLRLTQRAAASKQLRNKARDRRLVLAAEVDLWPRAGAKGAGLHRSARGIRGPSWMECSRGTVMRRP